MTNPIVILFLVLINIVNAQALQTDVELQVSAGGGHSCALDKEGVRCWGSNSAGQSTVPKLINPTQISAGGAHTCVIDTKQIICWGYNKYGQTDVPNLVNPSQVSAGSTHTCALDDEGVKCWGDSRWGQLNLPRLVNPKFVSASVYETCALDESGLKCSKDSQENNKKFEPPLVSPTQISVGTYEVCVIDEGKVKCRYANPETIPNLKNPKQVAVGNNGCICALDSEGVKCWGKNLGDILKVPKLVQPTSLSVAGNHACAVDIGGIKCWGSNDIGQTDVPGYLNVNELTSIPEGLKLNWSTLPASNVVSITSKHFYAYRSLFYNEAGKICKEFENDKKAIAFLVSVVGIDVLENTSVFFNRSLKPKFKNYQEYLLKGVGISSLFQIPKSENVLHASIALTKGVLLSSKQILNAEASQEMISEFLARLGKIEADPQIAKMQDLLKDMTEFSKVMSETQKLFGMSQVLLVLNGYFNQ